VGVMVAVRASEDIVTRAIVENGVSSEVSIAAVNGATSVVLSGSEKGVGRVLESLSGMASRKLNVSRAFHSPLMGCVLNAYANALETVTFRKPKYLFISTVYGREVSDELTSVKYWLDHVSYPVLYKTALETCLDMGDYTYVEMGADSTLTRMAGSVSSHYGHSSIICVHGCSFNEQRSIARDSNLRVAARRNHRLMQKVSVHEISGVVESIGYLHQGIRRDWAGDLVLHEQVVIPGAAYVDLIFALWSHTNRSTRCCCIIEDLSVLQPIVMERDLASLVTLRCTMSKDGVVEVHGLRRKFDVDLGAICKGQITSEGSAGELRVFDDNELMLENQRRACDVICDVGSLYEKLASAGLRYGDTFRVIQSAMGNKNGTVMVCELKCPSAGLRSSYFLPPPLIEGLCQSVASLFLSDRNRKGALALRSMGKVHIRNQVELSDLWDSCLCIGLVEIVSSGPTFVTFDCGLFSSSGHCVMVCEEARAELVSESMLQVGKLWSSEDAASEIGYFSLGNRWVEESIVEGGKAKIDSVLVVGQEGNATLLREHLSEVGEGIDKDQLFVCSLADIINGSFVAKIKYSAVIIHNTGVDNPVSEEDLDVDTNFSRQYFSSRDILLGLERLCDMTKKLVFVFELGEFDSIDTHGHRTALCSLIRTAQLEYPKVDMKLYSYRVDANVSEDVLAASRRLIDEISVESNTEMEVFDDKGKRFVRRYVQVPVHEQENANISVLSGAYIITGGLGGLGLLTAKVLVEVGVKHLVLLSRSGKVSYEGQGLEEQLRWLLEDSGADVRVMRCDVSDESSVVSMLESVRSMEGWDGRISGVVHGAGVLRDAVIRGGKAALGANEVWVAKAFSAYLLHKHTAVDGLRMFICFSSITAAVGTIGQSSYAAANGYMEGLMAARRVAGLPGIALRWPAISGVGMAAALFGDLDKDWSLNAMECSLILRQIFTSSVESIIAFGCLTLIPKVYLRSPEALKSRISSQYGELIKLLSPSVGKVVRKSSRETVYSSWDIHGIRALVIKLASSLSGVEIKSTSETLLTSSMDSLGASELAGQLSKDLDIYLSPNLIFSYPTVDDIVNHICEVKGVRSAEGSSLESVIASVMDALKNIVGENPDLDHQLSVTESNFAGTISTLGRLEGDFNVRLPLNFLAMRPSIRQIAEFFLTSGSVADEYEYPSQTSRVGEHLDGGSAPSRDRIVSSKDNFDFLDAVVITKAHSLLAVLSQLLALVLFVLLHVHHIHFSWSTTTSALDFMLSTNARNTHCIDSSLYFLGATLLSLIVFLSTSGISVVALKWALLGRLEEGEHIVYSLFYWRWWFVRIYFKSIASMQRFLLTERLSMPFMYRLLGARVGSACRLDINLLDWDLLDIGNEVVIDGAAAICTSYVKDSKLHLRKIAIGDKNRIEKHAVVLGRAHVPAESHIKQYHSVINSTTYDSSGQPKSCLVKEGFVTDRMISSRLYSVSLTLAMLVLHCFILSITVTMCIWAGIPSTVLSSTPAVATISAVVGICLYWMTFLVVTISLKRLQLFLRGNTNVITAPGGLFFRDILNRLTHSIHPLLRSILFVPLYNALGARISYDAVVENGASCSLEDPEGVEIRAGARVGSDVTFTSVSEKGGVIIVGNLVVEENCFLGDGSLLSSGKLYRKNTRLPSRTYNSGSNDARQISFQAPDSVDVAHGGGLANHLIFSTYGVSIHSFKLCASIFCGLYAWKHSFGNRDDPVLVLSIAILAFSVASLLIAILVKHIFVGEVSRGKGTISSTPRFSYFFGADSISNFGFLGGPLANIVLNALGGSASLRSILFTMKVRDYDMISIEEGACISEGVVICGSVDSGEDEYRLEKVVVGAGAFIGPNTCLLGTSNVSEAVSVAPNSFVSSRVGRLSTREYLQFGSSNVSIVLANESDI